jgi:hypothetical protein
MKSTLWAIALFLASTALSHAASGPIASGENKDGAITIGSTDSWTFSAAAGETLLFRLGEVNATSAFDPVIRLLGPGNALIATASQPSRSSTDAAITFRTTTAGTYTLTVADSGTAIGSYRLHFLSVPAGFTVPTGDEGGTLTNGGNHDGAIGLGDLDAWTVAAGANETLLFRLGETNPTSGFDPAIRLYGPDGVLITTASWPSRSTTDAAINFRTTAAGTYTLVVSGTAAGDGGAGSYRLHFLRMPGAFAVPTGDEGGALTNGGNHDGAITQGDLDAWTVAAGANETLLFRLGETNPTSAFDPAIRLYGPDGVLITTASQPSRSTTDAAINFRTTAAGTYTLVVSGTASGDGGAGSYRLHFLRMPGAFVVPTGDEGGALTNGGNHDGAITNGDLDAWTVAAAANETLLFRLGEVNATSAFDPAIRLYGPDGVLITTASQPSRSTTDATISFRTTAAGTYTLVVSGTAAGDGGEGSYRLHFLRIPVGFTVPTGDEGGALASGGNHDGAITNGDLDAWTTTVAANETLLFRLGETNPTSGFDPAIRLYGPDGVLITTASQPSRSTTDAAITFRTSAAGTYTLVVSGTADGDGGAGSYRLHFLRIPGGFTVPAGDEGGALINGTNHDGAITLGDLDAWTVSAAGGDTLRFRLIELNATSGFDPAMRLFGSDGVLISSASQPSSSTTDVTLTHAVTGAGTYTLVVSGTPTGDGGAGSYRLSVTGGSPPSAPTIAVQPVFPATVIEGSGVTLSVGVTGTPPISYQWRKDGVAISGATNASFTIANPQFADAGVYSVVVSNTLGSATSNGATLTVVPAIASRISNVSVRTTLAASQTLIVGMSMAGGLKPVLLRAVGPGLAQFGVPGTMPDPQLALFDGATQIDANDNWGGGATLAAAFVSVGAFALPAVSLDAALVRSIDGARTAQVRGTVAGGVLVEAYDAGDGNTPRLTNISARNRVGTGADILIAGFVIAGTGSKTVLIRAVGPTLAAFGVTGTLADPKLEIYSGPTKINENDTWAAALAPTFTAVGAFQLTTGSRDAALVATLPAGSYTVQVSGADGGTGEALIEIYEVTP